MSVPIETIRFCPVCAGYLETRTKIVEVMAKGTAWYPGTRRKRVKQHRRERWCPTCNHVVRVMTASRLSRYA